MSVSVIVCAGGKGERAGFEKNKLFAKVLDTPLLLLTLQALQYDFIEEIIVAHAPCDKAEIMALTAPFEKVKLVEGGSSRFETVDNALQAVTKEIVLIHDGARPFVTKEMLLGCIDSVKKYGSGICAVSCTDTVAVKSEGGKIIEVPDRKTLVNIQTPQGFYTNDIIRAYTQARTREKNYTDDSSVYAEFVGQPVLCEGSEENIKFTHPTDFKKFEKAERVGFGVDTHAFGKPQDYITLCGVKVPSETGLIAHSDGDVAVHALMDAMLSAVGLKDIGHYFPDTDEQWRGANSMQMLKQVLALIKEQGFTPKNVSIAIQAEKPRLAKYIGEMKEQIAATLNLDLTAVGITAGTNEKLGYVGEGKGITTYATVLLRNLYPPLLKSRNF